MSIELIVYLAVVGALGLVAFVRTLLWIRRVQRVGEKQMAGLRSAGPVRTRSPLDNPVKVARERGLRSLEASFTVTRRLLVPFIGLIVVTLLSVPFLTGIPAALVTVIATAITVLFGVAARPYLENAIAGLVISASRMVNLGDIILIDDMYGTVEDVTTTHTAVKLWDWKRYVIPNSQMLQSRFYNYTLFDRYIWTHVEFKVAHDADLDKVRELAMAAPLGSPAYAPHEPPRFWVMNMDEHSITCWVAAWADDPVQMWQLATDIRVALVRGFREHGIATHSYRHFTEASRELGPAEAPPGPHLAPPPVLSSGEHPQ